MFIADAVRSLDLGYDYGGPLFNFPATGSEGEGAKARTLDDREILLGEDDLLLLQTRPPMDDLDVGCRRPIQPSETPLERRLFADDGPLRKWFTRCARSEIVLSNAAADISPEIRRRQRMWFRQHGGAACQSYSSARGQWTYPEKSDPWTVAFLVYAEHAWPGGPKLLASFGMGGTATLVWATLLADRFADLLLTTPFAMVELSGKWPKYPGSMAFAKRCEATILGAAPASETAVRSRYRRTRRGRHPLTVEGGEEIRSA